MMSRGGDGSVSGRGVLVGLMGDVSGVNSNGVWMLLSIASKLENPDDGLVSDDEGRVSGGNGK